MDQQTGELKELIQRSIALSEENNKMLHGIRRSARISSFMRMLWIALLIGASVYSYLYFQPYINQILEIYSNVQGLQQKAQGFFSQPGQ